MAGVPAAGPELRTARLLLRRWRPEDVEPFARLNADPAVMEYFPAALTPAETEALVRRIEEGFAEHGFGLWAVEVPGTTAFAGFVGLHPVDFDAAFVPAVEVGWRLARSCWGHGYATEAARAAVAFGFGRLGLAEIVSFTAVANHRSRQVMHRLAMSHDPRDDFDHPRVPAGHPLRRHVLYRLAAPDRS